MGLGKTVTKVLDNKTAAASSSTSISDCTAEDLSAALQCAIQVDLTFNASATQGATVKVYASSDGTNFDTEGYEYATQSIAFLTGGGAVHVTFPINPACKYFKVVVTNLDSGQSITGITVWTIVQE